MSVIKVINSTNGCTGDVSEIQGLVHISVGKERYTVREAAKILVQNADNKKCTKTPLKVHCNMSFLVNVSTYKTWENVKSDMNGAYHCLLHVGTWTLDKGEDANAEILEEKKVPPGG